MSQAESVMNELESLGAVGDKVVLLKPVSNKPVEPEPVREEVPAKDHTVQLREAISTLSQKALDRLDVIAEEVQNLRKVFLALQEATKGEPHAKVQEEA